MKFGMTDEQYSLLEQLIIAPLKKEGAQVYIFGSRVSDHHHSHSDVDILYTLEKSKSLPAGFIAQIKENVEESRFPFIVDLVSEDDLASSYRESVFSSRVKII